MSACLYSCLHYPACKTHPFCNGATILFHIHKGHDFQKKLLNTGCVLWFALQLFVWTFLVLRRVQQDIIINVNTSFKQSTCHFCQILIKFQFSQQIFKKSSDIKYTENLSSGSQGVPCRHIDGQTDMIKLIVAFCNFVNVPKNHFKSPLYQV